MNDNRQVKIDDYHDRREFVMSGPEERDAYARTYPLIMPATHELVYWWEGLTLKVETRLRPVIGVVAEPEIVSMTSPEVVPPGFIESKLDAISNAEAIRRKFDALKPLDLETEAGVLGVAVKDEKGKQRKKPLIVADMVAAALKVGDGKAGE